MSHYTRHVAMIVPVNREAPALQGVEARMRKRDSDTFDDFFSVRLSATGEEPATHLGCHTALTEDTHRELASIRAQAQGMRTLTTETNGKKVASFDDLVEEMGLKRIVGSMDDGLDEGEGR